MLVSLVFCHSRNAPSSPTSASRQPRYAWLNHALVVGVGKQFAAGPIYRLYEIG